MVYNPLKLPDSPLWATGGWYHHELVRTSGGLAEPVPSGGGELVRDGVPEPAKPADEDSGRLRTSPLRHRTRQRSKHETSCPDPLRRQCASFEMSRGGDGVPWQ